MSSLVNELRAIRVLADIVKLFLLFKVNISTVDDKWSSE